MSPDERRAADRFALWVDAGPERRRYGPGALPLGLGGADAEIHLDVPAQCGRLAELLREGADLLLEPVPGAAPLLLNDRLLEERTLLRPGDRIRAGGSELRFGRSPDGGPELALASAEAATLPPQLASSAPVGDTLEAIPIPLAPLALRPPARPRPGPRWSWRSGAAAAAASLLLGLLALASRTVWVEVHSEPPGAALRWPDSWFALGFGERRLVLPGLHRVRLELAGYRPAERTLDAAASGEPLRVALEPLPGKLSVRTAPTAAAAELEIDGEPRGAAPLAALELAPGPHHVRARAPHYQPAERDIEITGRGETQELELALAPNFATLSVRSDPPGARLRIDGEERGTTPAQLEIEAGARRLELELGGYEVHSQLLQVQPNQPLELPPIALAPARARVALTSEPDDAQVTVDGQFRGSTPLTLALEPGREHRLALGKPGYAPATRALRIASGETRALRVALQPRLGAVRLRVRPPDAQLRVDGKLMGVANQRLELVAIPHEIEVQREGYRPYRTSVIPRPGFEKRLDVTLERGGGLSAVAERPRAAAQRAESVAGQAMVRVEPGGLEMGTPVSDPDRRANETPRRVVLTRAYYLGAREISNREFRAFRPTHSSGAFSGADLNGDEQPVVQVSWEDAARFCNWLSAREALAPAYEEREGRMVPVDPVPAGYRLPTEAEWALAARAGGAAERPFPWGERLPPPPGSGNYGDKSAADLLPVALGSYEDGFAATSPVGSFTPSSLGLYDMGGNAAEWIHDYYAIPLPDPGLERDPVGPARGVYHVIRGSSWKHATRTELRLEFRDYGDGPRTDVGFRIARYAD